MQDLFFYYGQNLASNNFFIANRNLQYSYILGRPVSIWIATKQVIFWIQMSGIFKKFYFNDMNTSLRQKNPLP